MKILLVCEAVFPENKGGIERWFQTLAGEFLKQGHEIEYFNASNVNLTRAGIAYKCSTKGKWTYKAGGVRSKSQAIKFGIRLYLFLRKEKYDLVYCSSVPIFSVLSLAFSKSRNSCLFVEWFEIWRLRYWMRYSGIFLGTIGWIIQLLALQVGKYRVVYTESAKKSVSKLGFLNNHDVVMLPGLCPESVKEDVFRSEGRKDDIYFLGRFVNEKQPLLALNIIQELIETGWPGKLWLLGTGPLVSELKLQIEERKLEQKVELIVNPTDTQVESVIRNSYILLHPSRREGYGLASVEAAYHGVPTLLIDYPDNATVDLGIAPTLVAKTEDVSEIVKLLKLAWTNQQQYKLETLAWAEQARVSKSSVQSCRKILEIALANRKAG